MNDMGHPEMLCISVSQKDKHTYNIPGDEGVQAQDGAGVRPVVVLRLGEHGDRASHPKN